MDILPLAFASEYGKKCPAGLYPIMPDPNCLDFDPELKKEVTAIAIEAARKDFAARAFTLSVSLAMEGPVNVNYEYVNQELKRSQQFVKEDERWKLVERSGSLAHGGVRSNYVDAHDVAPGRASFTFVRWRSLHSLQETDVCSFIADAVVPLRAGRNDHARQPESQDFPLLRHRYQAELQDWSLRL